MPDPKHKRPSTMKRQARHMQLQARRLMSCASTPGVNDVEEYNRLTQEASRLLAKRERMLQDPQRAVHHPATMHTASQGGAGVGAPLEHFPRALRRTLLDLGLSTMDADHFVRVEKKDDEQEAARRKR